MVYKVSKNDITQMFANEESITIQIKKLEGDDFLIRLTAESGATKLFITDNWEDLFKD